MAQLSSLADVRERMESRFREFRAHIQGSFVKSAADVYTTLRLDTMNFLLSMAAEGENLSERAAQAVAELFDYNYTVAEWHQYMAERRITEPTFVKTLPYSYHLLLQAEQVRPSIGSPCFDYADLMNEVSYAFFKGDFSPRARRRRENYLVMLATEAMRKKRNWRSFLLPSRTEEDKIEAARFAWTDANPEDKKMWEATAHLGQLLKNPGIKKFFTSCGRDGRLLLNDSQRNWLCWLAGADGDITAAETVLINRLVGSHDNTFSLQWRYSQMQKAQFGQAIPTILDRFAEADKLTLRSGVVLDDTVGASFIRICYDSGLYFLKRRGYVTEKEAEVFRAYIRMLEKFYFVRNRMPRSTRKSLADRPIETIPSSQQGAAARPTGDLESLLKELDSLTGLRGVKKEVRSLVHLQQMQRQRRREGLKPLTISNHLVFSGNPGTGKTTVARLLASIYYRLGVLQQDKLTEVDRSGLVGSYVGQTALKVQEVITKARGGILFIDEAYTLSPKGCTGNDYGQEAIDTLLKAMEDHRDDLVVIVAGYTEPMERFIASNPGLKSRFNKYLQFEDYQAEELMDIFRRFCRKNDYTLSLDAERVAGLRLRQMHERRGENFANAREVRNYFETVVSRQATRLYGTPNADKEALTRIEALDVV